VKRAYVIVTDADYVFVTEAWTDRTTQEARVEPSEQLLADLRTLTEESLMSGFEDVRVAAARVRALCGVSAFQKAERDSG
jgi:hypothetical protein